MHLSPTCTRQHNPCTYNHMQTHHTCRQCCGCLVTHNVETSFCRHASTVTLLPPACTLCPVRDKASRYLGSEGC